MRSSHVLVVLLAVLALLVPVGALVLRRSEANSPAPALPVTDGAVRFGSKPAADSPTTTGGPDLARDYQQANCENGVLPLAQCPGIRRVRMGEISVHGALSAEIVRRVLQRHRDELRTCYERELGPAARLAGSLEVAFTISSLGAVQAARVHSSTLADQGLDACVVQAVQRWTFPAPAQATAEVRYPFSFEYGS